METIYIYVGFSVLLIIIAVVLLVVFVFNKKEQSDTEQQEFSIPDPKLPSEPESSTTDSGNEFCNVVHVWPKTKANETAMYDCISFGGNYTGGIATRMCDAQGNWSVIDFSGCEKTGLIDKIDITGKWEYSIGGSNYGIVDLDFDLETNTGTISNWTLPETTWDGWVETYGYDKIKYEENTGYLIAGNPPMTFKDDSFTELTNGGVTLKRVV